MHILMTSPVPTHPISHGNRARVATLASELQARGHTIHFVYTGFEGLDEAQEEAMRRQFEQVTLLQEQARRPAPLWRHHAIDAWYPKTLDATIDQLLADWHFDACIANYVWCSRWLKRVPRTIPRYIDTHDRFADRHARLKADGLAPSWFSTSKAGEAKALKRASRVFAIQDEEAGHFERLSTTPVDVVGHLLAPDFLDTPRPENQPLRLGYIGSNNMLNIHAVEKLGAALESRPALDGLFELHLAGPVSDTPEARAVRGAVRHGFVESPRAFYQGVDVILNPHIGGTGLKIKTVEALAYGMPLMATRWAMIGIPSDHPDHQHGSLESFAEGLGALIQQVAEKPSILDGLREASRQTFMAYEASQRATLDRLFPADDSESAIGAQA